MVDALVPTGGLEQVARRPNARHKGEERRHSRGFVPGRFIFPRASAPEKFGETCARGSSTYCRVDKLAMGDADTAEEGARPLSLTRDSCPSFASNPRLRRRLTDAPRQPRVAASPTCNALNLGKTCCLTFTFFFCPFILVQFGLIKYHPAFAVVSMLILPPTVFYLMWLMALEFLMCATHSRPTLDPHP